LQLCDKTDLTPQEKQEFQEILGWFEEIRVELLTAAGVKLEG
jgi:hypothetical protein